MKKKPNIPVAFFNNNYEKISEEILKKYKLDLRWQKSKKEFLR